MTKNTILLSALLFSGFIFPQVGINTENPKGIFNIDGGKDNPVTGNAHTSAQQLNDFTVTAAGNVGIGTISPSQKLDIRTGGTSTAPVTGFRLDDGNQNPGYVLTATDTNGTGTWKPVGMSVLTGTFTNVTNNIPFSAGAYTQTGASIILPPGLWRIDLTQLIRGNVYGSYTLPNNAYAFVRFSLSDSNATSAIALSNDFVRLQPSGSIANSGAQFVSTTFEGPVTGSLERHWKTIIATGSMTIRNNTSANKIYYLVGHVLRTNMDVSIDDFSFRNLGSSYWAENSMYAIPIVAL